MATGCYSSSFSPGYSRCSCRCVLLQLCPSEKLSSFQVLGSRLGCVTGLGMRLVSSPPVRSLTQRLDLAAHCRLLLHDRPRHKMFWRWGVLYPLYALSEVAIVATDLAELLGSAIALSLLFPKLDVWAGVLITTADVLLLLALRNPIGGHPVRAFELGIAALVSVSSFAIRSSLVRSLESPQLFPYAIHAEVSIPIHSFEFPHLMSVSSTRSRLV